ncbi:unnamed protein product [Lathyrus sativus]|nr:unnamed protein product [Lathyrus sativus]
MLLTQSNPSTLEAIIELFDRYSLCFGQVCNPAKSIMFASSMVVVRYGFLASKIGFKMGFLRFLYLGAHIFKGRPKASYFQPVVDKIRIKLAAGKASLLSIAGRVQLVNSVIHNMLLYSFRIYSWPVSLINQIETRCRNFIWSGNIKKRKMATVAWKSCCQDLKDEGLGIRSLHITN